MKHLYRLLLALNFFSFAHFAHADSIDVTKQEQKEQSVGEWLKEKTEDFGKIFSDTGKDVGEALTSFVDSIWKKTAPEREELKKHAEQKLKEVTKDLDEKVDKAKGILEQQAKAFSQAFKEGLEKAEQVLSERSGEITEELKKELDKLAEEIKKQTQLKEESSKNS